MEKNKMFVSVIITAGGSGVRFSSRKKKQYFKINKKSILEWTVQAFYQHPEVNQIIITVPVADLLSLTQKFSSLFPGIILTAGGKSRQESVFNGLKNCPSETDIVLIHDAVRPFVYANEITSLIQSAARQKAVIPVTKVKYTIKRFQGNEITETINRDELLEVHTPQAFDYQLIMSFHQQAQTDHIDLTDDAGLCEYYHTPVFFQFCSNDNIKITNPEDLNIAKSVIKKFINEENHA